MSDTPTGPDILESDLSTVYHEMAAEEEREADALEWAEATLGDIAEDSDKVRWEGTG